MTIPTSSPYPTEEKRYLLYDIIRPVDVIIPKVDAYHEKIVYIDIRSKETSYGKPWYWIWRDVRTFWVSSQRYVMLRGFDCYIDDLQTGQFIRIDITCRVQLIQGAEHRAVTYLHREVDLDEGFKKFLVNAIKNFSAGKEHIIKNYFSIEKDLIETVSKEAERYGFKIELFLSPFAGSLDKKEYALIRHTIRCQIRDWEIQLLCTVVLNLWDERRYKMSRIDDLEKWMKEKIERITQGILIDKTITDILKGYPAQEIQLRLEAEAYDIGFRVKQLLSIPQIEAFELLRGFQFETEPNPESKDAIFYTTTDIRVPVRLNISVKGKIDSFEGKIERYLKPKFNLIQCMREEVIDEAAFFIRGIPPERFYLHFSSNYDEKGPFENELAQKIEQLLAVNFNARDLTIHITQLETGLTQRFRQLAGRFGSFACQGISEQIRFLFKFSVTGVDKNGWYTFKSRIYDDFQQENLPVRDALKNTHTIDRERAEEELLSIGNTMRQHIELFLNSHHTLDLYTQRDSDLIRIIRLTFDEAAKLIVHSHGLVIELVALERLQTGEDINYKKQQLDVTIKTTKEEQTKKDVEKSTTPADKSQATTPVEQLVTAHFEKLKNEPKKLHQ